MEQRSKSPAALNQPLHILQSSVQASAKRPDVMPKALSDMVRAAGTGMRIYRVACGGTSPSTSSTLPIRGIDWASLKDSSPSAAEA
jgi:hypothetical protein